MMEPIVIDPQELQDWMRNSWQLYASDIVGDKLLRLWVNHLIEYRVVYYEKVLYQGSRMSHVIEAWNSLRSH